MALNKHFSFYGQNFDNSNEQNLINSLHSEAIQIHGIEVFYIPKTENQVDQLFGEDVMASFETYYPIEMYLDSIDQFDGNDFLASFGVAVTDKLEMTVSRTRFIEETGMEFPEEGDLIMLPLAPGSFKGNLFQITFVEDESQFYPLGTLPSFKIRAQLFNHSMEDFATGNDDIDSIVGLDLPEDKVLIPDDEADNTTIDDGAKQDIDFSESNPFGDF